MIDCFRLVQLDKTCSQLVGKTNIIRSVLESGDTKTVCDEAFVSEIQMDYMNDCPLYEAKLAQLNVPRAMLNMRFKQADDVSAAISSNRLLVETENGETGVQSFAELSLNCSTEVGEEASASDTDNSNHLFESFESEHRRSSHCSVQDPYPKRMLDLVNFPVVQQKVHEYDGLVKRLAMVNGEVWTVMSDGLIVVLQPDTGSIKRKFKVKERDPDPSWWSRLLHDDLDIMYDCMMVCEGREGDIVCLGKKLHNKSTEGATQAQLVMINDEGLVRNKLAAEDYVDITTDDKSLFALIAGTPNKVDIFRTDGAKGSSYLHMRTVNLETGRTYYRLLAIAGILYTSGLRHEVHKYHIETTQRYTHGTHGSRLAGELDTPKLCCVDDYGIILVADCQNHRLQILDREKQWHVVDVSRTTSCPWDAGWDARTGHLFYVSAQVAGKNILNRAHCKPKPMTSTP